MVFFWFFVLSISLIFSGVGLIVWLPWILMLILGRDKRAKNGLAKVEQSLMKGETLIIKAIELRLHALFRRRRVVSITDSRVILFKRKILGGFQMVDFQWKDIHDVEISENWIPNLFGSKLVYQHQDTVKKNFVIDLESEEASKIYKFSQEKEQEWEEKRRVRQIEEARAVSGGLHINTHAQQIPPTKVVSPAKSIAEQIKEAKQMLDDGIISDVEYNEMKSKILQQGVV